MPRGEMPAGEKFSRSATCAFLGKRYFWRHFCTMAFFHSFTLLFFDLLFCDVSCSPGSSPGHIPRDFENLPGVPRLVQTGFTGGFLISCCPGRAQFSPGRILACRIYVATPKIGHALSGAGKNWARAEQRNRIRLGVPLVALQTGPQSTLKGLRERGSRGARRERLAQKLRGL